MSESFRKPRPNTDRHRVGIYANDISRSIIEAVRVAANYSPTHENIARHLYGWTEAHPESLLRLRVISSDHQIKTEGAVEVGICTVERVVRVEIPRDRDMAEAKPEKVK